MTTTLVSAGLLAIVVEILILSNGDGEGLWRLVGVLAILATTGSLVTAIMQRLDRQVAAPETARETECASGAVRCPHCDGELSAEFLADATESTR